MSDRKPPSLPTRTWPPVPERADLSMVIRIRRLRTVGYSWVLLNCICNVDYSHGERVGFSQNGPDAKWFHRREDSELPKVDTKPVIKPERLLADVLLRASYSQYFVPTSKAHGVKCNWASCMSHRNCFHHSCNQLTWQDGRNTEPWTSTSSVDTYLSPPLHHAFRPVSRTGPRLLLRRNPRRALEPTLLRLSFRLSLHFGLFIGYSKIFMELETIPTPILNARKLSPTISILLLHGNNTDQKLGLRRA
ncbi:hypothetical protein F4818DRAFT_317433 [Hypoxylon cercidicola]|nr:hypothetical protein F4818DRAFT_317433 [Hypoxylon cercidicola]